MPIIDLHGVYPAELHYPTVLARSTVDQHHVFPLLFDTGLSISSCMFHEEQKAQYQQFSGATQETSKEVTISLAPVSGGNGVTIGNALALPTPLPTFARAAQLMVKLTRHATAISHHYFLKGQPRLVAFWNIAPAIPRTPVTLPPDDLLGIQDHYGHHVQIYTVPLSFVDPASAAHIPQAANQVALQVEVRMLKGTYTKIGLSRGGQVVQVDANLDTGASYVVIRDRVASFFGLSTEDDARVVIPRLDFPNANPALSLLNVPADVVRTNSLDDITIGSALFDRFSQVVFDLNEDAGVIRLLP